jgi:hypothetical protein
MKKAAEADTTALVGAIGLAVSLNLECAHRAPVSGKLHGHSYVLTVWFQSDRDIDCMKTQIEAIAQPIRECELEESVGGQRMEDIIAWLIPRLDLLQGMSVTRINVARPTLGYQAEWRR